MNNTIKSPTVSVIIPSYNCASTIREAIDSVRIQTYKNIEIIVIDDGSYDQTKEILKPYVSDNKILYVYQNNQGVSKARNAGLNISKGEYVKFLDGDDFLYPKQIELQIEDMAKHQSTVCFTGYEKRYSNGSRHENTIQVKQEELLAYLIAGINAPFNCYLFKKDALIAQGGFDETLLCCEDRDLLLRLFINGEPISKIDHIGCCYQISEDSLSSDYKTMFLNDARANEKMNQLLASKWNSLSEKVMHQILLKNIQILYQSFAWNIPIGKEFCETIRLTQKISNHKRKDSIKLLVKILGIKNFIFLKYLKNCLSIPHYRMDLIEETKSWREPPKKLLNERVIHKLDLL
jgi:glycosyltransferase involved in cell wall biosynthesis